MRKILVLFGVILISSACSKTTTASLEEKANELCMGHGGVALMQNLEKMALCADATTVHL